MEHVGDNLILFLRDTATQLEELQLQTSLGISELSEKLEELKKESFKKYQQAKADINTNIESLLTKINSTSKNASNNSLAMLKVSEESQESEEALKRTQGDFIEIQKINTSISEEFLNTTKEIDKIINSIKEINSLSSDNARNTEEIASASEHLYKMTESLNNKLNEFRT